MVTNVEALDDQTFHVTFHVRNKPGFERKIIVAGTFNNWELDTGCFGKGISMPAGGHQEITVALPKGWHEYKYYDASNATWLEVESEPETYFLPEGYYRANVFGTRNCHLRLP